MKRRVLVACLAAMLSSLVAGSAWSCSRLMLHTGKVTCVARTMDLYMPDQAKMVVHPRGISRDGGVGPSSLKWTSRYGSVAMTAFDLATDDGMNEKGLSVHLLYLHGTQYEARDGRPGVGNSVWAQYLLDTCATVDEVVSSLKTFQVVSMKVQGREWPLHVACEDASGDSAIIEYVSGKMVVHHGRQYPVMTNEPTFNEQLENLKRYRLFGGKLSMPGDIDPLSRFVRAASYLKTLPEPKDANDATALVLGVARTIAVPYGAHDTSGGDSADTWPTLWFSVCDLGQHVFYFSSTRSPNVIWLDFERLRLSKGSPVMTLDPNDPSLVGEVSGSLRPGK